MKPPRSSFRRSLASRLSCTRASRWWLGLGPLLVLTACSPAWHVASADREVQRLLDDYNTRIIEQRAESVRHPAERADEADETPAAPGEDEPEAAPAPELVTLDLKHALELAFTSSRDFLSQRESLYLQGLGFTLTRYNFGPILDSTISYLWSNTEDGLAADNQGVTFGVSDILPTGGRLVAELNLEGTRADDPKFMQLDGRFLYDPAVQVNLRQPLLRGAGYEVSHESLTQSERNLIYAVRRFELFRQDFSIQVANAYFRLVSQKARLVNDEQNYEDAVFDRNKAEALRRVDRNKDEDVFLARRREIEAEDALLVARTDYELALDDFKILLGLPTSTEIRIVPAEPEFEEVRVDPASAVAVALHNRLDLHTERDQLEDAERQVRLTRHDLLPDLEFAANAGLDGDSEAISDFAPNQWSTSVGFTLELPLDRKRERNSYRAALILLDEARRETQRSLDEVERDVLNQVRELGQLERRLQLQTDQIEREKRAVAVTSYYYEAGDVDNRDLLDARQGLTNAQNALIDLKVQHFIGRLRLQRTLGVLFIDEKGRWHS